MSVSYADLKNLVSLTKKTTAIKSFGVIERKIQKEYLQQNKDQIKYLKKLIKNITTNKETDISNVLGNVQLSKEEKLDKLQKLLDDQKQYSIPSDFSLMIQDLPKTLQILIKPRSIVVAPMAKKQPIKLSNKIMKKIRSEDLQEKDVKAKEVISIEPLDFFVLLPFYVLQPEQSKILEEILELDENMMPKKYTIFENFNTIVEKSHLTGEYFEYNINQSTISKKFLELEPSLRNVLFDFTKLNKKAIKQARDEMLELNAVYQILQDFKPKDYSKIAPLFIKNIIRIYSNLIKNSKNDQNIINYLIRSIQVLDYRRKQLEKELPQILKDDDKRKFLTKETAALIQNPPQIQPNIQEEDAQIGEHYNERFEDQDLDFDMDIVMEEDSMLLGGSHFIETTPLLN